MEQLRDGKYHAKIVRWNVRESTKTAAIGVSFDVICIKREAEDGSFVDIQPPYPEIEGTTWIIDKNGVQRSDVIENLKIASGWDGTFDQLSGRRPWDPSEVQVTLDYEEYDGKRRLRVQWINPIVQKPGARFLGDDREQRLRDRFNAAMNGKKPAPPPVDELGEAFPDGIPPQDDIPF